MRGKTVVFNGLGLFSAFLIPVLAVHRGRKSGSRTPIEVRVTLTEFKIESSLTTFRVGVPYHFIVTNKGHEPHELMLIMPMPASGGMQMGEMDKMALAHIEEKDLPPGGTALLDHTFTAPAAAGELELACHIAGHHEAGMKRPITVTK